MRRKASIIASAIAALAMAIIRQPAPAGPSSCPRLSTGNNFDASGQIFNVFDKSPAYTSVLGSTSKKNH